MEGRHGGSLFAEGRWALALGLCFFVCVAMGCGQPPADDAPSGVPANNGASDTTPVRPTTPAGATSDQSTPDRPAPEESTPEAIPSVPDPEPTPADVDVGTPDNRQAPVVPEDEPNRQVEPQAEGQAESPEPARDLVPEPVAVAWEGEVWEPKVTMSQSHAATCLVTVGDKMPSIELADLDGSAQRLENLLSDRLTVVVVWNSQYAYAREQRQRLAREVVGPFGSLGVHVVAINVGDDPDVVRQLASKSEGKVSDLVDPGRSVFERIATEKLPRTYLLDATGTILWLDIEYSRSSRRELQNALRYQLELDG